MAKLKAYRTKEMGVLLAVCAASTMLGFALGGNTGVPPRTDQSKL
jgi:hypothetical protein